MVKKKLLRGAILYEAIDALLSEMISLGFEERIKHLQAENAELVKQRDKLFEALFVISNICLAKGLDLEEVLIPLRKELDKHSLKATNY
ncbi:hypothetical protein [Pseudomonas sp. FYR_5]|uniref:hypothetical protein n=1 Tax=Pseudomonas sp. FYR_5 TaxID=3367173 RepID=UPI00370C92E3